MGVPGFFMWLWKNYKGTNFVFKKSSLDENDDIDLIERINNIDYLLIDTNCLLHPMCFEVLANEQEKLKNMMKSNKDIDIEKLENKMMKRCLEYIEKLIKIVEPKKGVYIAIDGVAPLAKIKQQRSRRFKSVNDKNVRESLKRKHNKDIDFFWNNSAITPGTKFMERLHKKILKNIKKMENIFSDGTSDGTSDRKLNVIYSSCKTPSEGEHKLLEYIKNNKNYSYVIYGLDADLVFLSLASDHTNTFLLREATHLKQGNYDEICYVDMEKVKDSILNTIETIIEDDLDARPLDLDLNLIKKNIIDDFVFICYLLGNDFLPHIEALDITHGGMDFILKKYSNYYIENLINKNLINENYQYIIDRNKDNFINTSNLYNFIKILAKEEDSILKKNFNNKKRKYGSQSSDPYEKELFRIEHLMFKIDDPIKLGSDNFEDYQYRYYNYYYNTDSNELDKFIKKKIQHYLKGLLFVTKYYFDKCPDWRWYFPYNNPPFLNDILKYFNKCKINKITFNEGKPLDPLVQLINVLPPQSSYLIPKNIRFLVNDNRSPLIHMFPLKFQQDFINKGMYWKSVPILPEVELNLVIKSFEKYKNKLTKKELERNQIILLN